MERELRVSRRRNGTPSLCCALWKLGTSGTAGGTVRLQCLLSTPSPTVLSAPPARFALYSPFPPTLFFQGNSLKCYGVGSRICWCFHARFAWKHVDGRMCASRKGGCANVSSTICTHERVCACAPMCAHVSMCAYACMYVHVSALAWVHVCMMFG
jgi:hypothetical protein